MPPKVRQISAFLEHRVGRLMEIARAIAKDSINIRGISVVNAGDFALVRLIVDKPDFALDALRRIDVVATEQEVLAVEIEDRPGKLAQLLTILAQAELNVEYTYGIVIGVSGKAVIILRISDVIGAGAILQESGLRLLSHEEVCGEITQ